MKDNLFQMKQPEFRCPYANLPLTRPCEVQSCSYNLNDNAAARVHNRCFLNYCDDLLKRPDIGAAKKEAGFASFPQEKRNKVASQFFDVSIEEVDHINTEFNVSLFAVFAEDVSVSLKKQQLDPVPFRQCCVCGTECENLFMPKGSLPSGYGYCSYGCFQMKPPPMILVEKNLDLDFLEFVEAMELDSYQGRAKFVRQLVEWVLGNTPLRL